MKIRGQNVALQNIAVSLLDSEFNVDYGFAIKYDPIQSTDLVMDFVLCAQTALSPQNQYHTLNKSPIMKLSSSLPFQSEIAS